MPDEIYPPGIALIWAYFWQKQEYPKQTCFLIIASFCFVNLSVSSLSLEKVTLPLFRYVLTSPSSILSRCSIPICWQAANCNPTLLMLRNSHKNCLTALWNNEQSARVFPKNWKPLIKWNGSAKWTRTLHSQWLRKLSISRWSSYKKSLSEVGGYPHNRIRLRFIYSYLFSLFLSKYIKCVMRVSNHILSFANGKMIF